MADNKATKEEVEDFLKRFKERTKWSVPRIFYIDDKPENIETLSSLDITGKDRDEYILNLQVEDYYQGPDTNHIPNQGDVWMFGKTIKGKEVYIKIFINTLMNQSNICISFHIAKSKIYYPFKQK